jgi:hypothetical protein
LSKTTGVSFRASAKVGCMDRGYMRNVNSATQWMILHHVRG